MYNDTHQLLLDLLEVLDPGQTLLGKLFRNASGVLLPHGWRSGRITRVAFVAPKMDLVYPDDRDKMVDLVKHFAERPAGDHNGLAALYTNCSAVVSTRVLPDDAGGRLLTGMAQGNENKFKTQGLPNAWPLESRPGTYVFPRVDPNIPPLRDCPPDQINLDKVINFLMTAT